VLSCINEYNGLRNGLRGSRTFGASFFGKLTESCFGIEQATRRHLGTVESEYGRTLSGPWASSFMSRTSDRYAKICGCTERLRHICAGWQRSSIQQGGYRASSWVEGVGVTGTSYQPAGGDVIYTYPDDLEYEATCQQLYGLRGELQSDEQECANKYRQVTYVCGLQQPPASFYTPQTTYSWPTSSIIRYGTPWYQNSSCLSQISKHVCYGATSPFPATGKSWNFPQRRTIVDSWNTGANLGTPYGEQPGGPGFTAPNLGTIYGEQPGGPGFTARRWH
jgi:hypothetical protein